MFPKSSDMSLVVRLWEKLKNRELGPLGESKSNCWSLHHVYHLDKSKSFQGSLTSVSKLAIVLIWNIQSPHEDNIVLRKLQNHNIESSGHNAHSTLLYHGDVWECSICDTCHFDIGHFCVSRLITDKVSTPERHIYISQCPQQHSFLTLHLIHKLKMTPYIRENW